MCRDAACNELDYELEVGDNLECPDCGVWVESVEPYAPYCSLEHRQAAEETFDV